jgi:hypothetical protein
VGVKVKRDKYVNQVAVRKSIAQIIGSRQRKTNEDLDTSLTLQGSLKTSTATGSYIGGKEGSLKWFLL